MSIAFAVTVQKSEISAHNNLVNQLHTDYMNLKQLDKHT